MSCEVRLCLDRTSPRPTSLAKLRCIRRGEPDCRWVMGDNLVVLEALQSELEGSVSLAYLDPPFLTGRTHNRVERTRAADSRAITRTSRPAFDDRWDSLRDYLDVLGNRLEAIRPTLASHGSIVVHVDSKTSHYVKVLCDEIYGQASFASEIIWRYRRWPAKTRNFQRVHDVLLRYVKDPAARPRFNQLYEPLAPSTRATWGTRKQQAVVAENGRRVRSSTTAETTRGAPLGDVWEIGIVAPVAKERTGYPTQKPEALLERLVSGLTNPGDLVLDPYAGSGTTLAVARRLGRRALGIDASAEAWASAEERLERFGRVRLERAIEEVARAS